MTSTPPAEHPADSFWPRNSSEDAAAQRPLAPSRAWRDDIFGSVERFDVKKNGKSSTRFQVFAEWAGRTIYGYGGYERTACQLLEQLWYVGVVRRWKSQPFNLEEIGGPLGLPDLLAETFSFDLHVVQVRAKRFQTPEVLAKYEDQASFLRGKGFHFHLWSNKDVLAAPMKHSLAHLDQARLRPAPADTIAKIKAAAQDATTLGELTNQFGWDDVMSSAASMAIHLDFTRRFDETTPLLRSSPAERYAYLLEGGDATRDWWTTLDRAHV
jgi:hypothetical protein